MKQNCTLPFVQKAASTLLACAMMFSAFAGLPARPVAADSSTDGGYITNLVSKEAMKKAVTLSGSNTITTTSTGASYSWGENDADWAFNIAYRFTIPVAKLLSIKSAAATTITTYDLDLPPEICKGIVAAAPTASNSTVSFPAASSFTSSIKDAESKDITPTVIGTVTVTNDKATLNLGQGIAGSNNTSITYDSWLNTYTSSTPDSYAPQCNFTMACKLEKTDINSSTSKQASLAYYFGGAGEKSLDSSYFALDLQFPEYVSGSPSITLSGHQVTTTRSVTVNGKVVTFTDVSSGEIEWTAIITPNNCSGTGLTYQMSGDTVGEYVNGSLSVKEIKSGASLSQATDSKTISVKFGNSLQEYANDNTKHIVLTYRTKPSVSIFKAPSYTSGVQPATQSADVIGTPELAFDGGSYTNAAVTVPFSQTWLRKQGYYDKANNDLYWILLFNENGCSIPSATIKETLNNQQTFGSSASIATMSDAETKTGNVWKTLDWTKDSAGTTATIALPDKANITKIDSPLYIYYTTKVSSAFFEQKDAETLTVSDDPTISFQMDGWSAEGTTGAAWATDADGKAAPITVTPGISALRKEGVYHADTHVIDWTIHVNEAAATWNYVDLQDTIDSGTSTSGSAQKQRLLLLNSTNTTDAVTEGTVDSSDFKKYINITDNDQNESTASGTITTTEEQLTGTSDKTYKSKIEIKWATASGNASADGVSKQTVLPIKKAKTIQYRTLITPTDAAEYTGNVKDGIKGTDYTNTASLIVNPGTVTANASEQSVPLSEENNKTLSSGNTYTVKDANPTPDDNSGRFVATKFWHVKTVTENQTEKYSVETSSDYQDEGTSKIVKDTNGNPLVAAYKYVKWDETTDNAVVLGSESAPKQATGTVTVTSTMLRAGFVNVLSGDANSNYDYVNHELKLQVIVNQNKQSNMRDYSIKDTLPEGTSYVEDSLVGTLTDSSGSTTPIGSSTISTSTSAADNTVTFSINSDEVNNKQLTLTFKIKITDDKIALALDSAQKPKASFILNNQTDLYASGNTKCASWASQQTGQSTTVDSPFIDEIVSPEDNTYKTVQFKLLINKVGATLTSTNKIPINITLPSTLQLKENSVVFQKVIVTKDGSSINESETNKQTAADYKSSSLSAGSDKDYTYSVADISNNKPGAGTLNLTLDASKLSAPCCVSFTAVVGTLAAGGSVDHTISYYNETPVTGKNITLSTVDSSGMLATPDSSSVPGYAVLQIQKVDSNQKPLAGAIFEIDCSDMSMLPTAPHRYASVASSSNGLVVFRVPANHTYTILENEAPTGYTMSSDSPFTKSTAAATTTSGVTVTPKQVGCVYQYYGKDSGFIADTESHTDKTVAPVINMLNNNSTLTMWAQTTSSTTKTATADSPITGIPLKNAKFNIYTNSDCTTPASSSSEMTSDNNGKLIFSGLSAGTNYYIKETTAPDLFDPDTNKYAVNISTDGTYTCTKDSSKQSVPLVVTNSAQTGSGMLKVTKQGEDTKAPLAGATFQLLTKDGNVFPFKASSNSAITTSLVSNSSGLATFENLPTGTFTLHESAAPDNYTVAADVSSIAVKTDGDQVLETVIDKRSAASTMGLIQISMTKSDSTSSTASSESEDSTAYLFKVALYSAVDDSAITSGSFNYSCTNGKTAALTLGTSSSSSSASSAATANFSAWLPLHLAGSPTLSVPVYAGTTATVEVPKGTHYIITPPEISGYTVSTSGGKKNSYAQLTAAPVTFNYTKTAAASSSSSNSSSSSGSSSSTTSGSSSATGSSASGSSSKSGSSTAASSTSNRSASGTSGTTSTSGATGTSGTTGTNGTAGTGSTSGTTGTSSKAASGTSGSTSSAKKGETLPKTSVPDTLPFWSVGLATSLLTTFFVIRWGLKMKKKGAKKANAQRK